MADHEIDITRAGNLTDLIGELGARLERGASAGRRGLWLGNELTLTDVVELSVASLLREVEVFAAMSPVERRKLWMVARRRKLADTLWCVKHALAVGCEW